MLKNIFKNIILIFLVFLIFFQIRILWFTIPEKSIEDKTKTIEYVEYLEPMCIIANFGENTHTKIYSTKDYLINYKKEINTILNLEIKDLKPISIDEYLNLQNNRSIVIKYINSPFKGYIDDGSKKISKEQVREIYLSEEKCVIVLNAGIYEVNLKANISQNLTALEEKTYKSYKNFYELYGIKRNIYVPQNNTLDVKDIFYSRGLNELTRTPRASLAKIYLNQDIDYIKEITDITETTYVYEDKILKLANNNMLIYKDTEESINKVDDFKNSYTSALRFISEKVGNINNISLKKIEQRNSEYTFYFDRIEDDLNVVMEDENDKFYIAIKVAGDTIKNFRQVYRIYGSDAADNKISIEVLPIPSIIEKNLNLFDNKDTYEILNQLKDIYYVYVDDLSNIDIYKTRLKIGVEIEYNNRRLIFLAEDGSFIMER